MKHFIIENIFPALKGLTWDELDLCVDVKQDDLLQEEDCAPVGRELDSFLHAPSMSRILE